MQQQLPLPMAMQHEQNQVPARGQDLGTAIDQHQAPEADHVMDNSHANAEAVQHVEAGAVPQESAMPVNPQLVINTIQ